MVIVEGLRGRQIEAREGPCQVALLAGREPAEEPGVGGEVRLVLAAGDGELAIEGFARLARVPLAPGDPPPHVPGERLLSAQPVLVEVALGAGHVAERRAVGEDRGQVVIVEGMDGDLLQVGQRRRLFAHRDVVVGAREPQRPGRRAQREEGRVGCQPVPVSVHGGGGGVADEQVQVGRRAGPQARRGGFGPGLRLARPLLPRAEETEERRRHRRRGIGGMGGFQQPPRLGAVADAFGGEGPRHQVDRFSALGANVAALEGIAGVDHLPGLRQR